MKRYDLVLDDFYQKIPFDYEFDNRYLNLYSDYPEKFKKIFAYLHSGYDTLLEFMNYKSASNKHFNAAPSRELIDHIKYYEDLREGLKNSENEIKLNKKYEDQLNYCKTFLGVSGGSPIPDDYNEFKIIKYEPVFEISSKRINIPATDQNTELRVIGEGAFSIVKRYKDNTYNRYFAIKQAKSSINDRELQRFQKEFEILQKLQFPYILEVYSYDKSKERYTMEYCDTTLREYISKRNSYLSLMTRKKIALQFLYGINYLHKKGILHRDISLNNVLVKLYDYDSVIIKLSDFGLIKEDKSQFTNTDTELKGTIIDPSLESFKNYAVRNEIYALGFILQYIFTGKRNLHFNDDGFSQILMKCTDKDINSRYKDVTQIIDDIDNLLT